MRRGVHKTLVYYRDPEDRKIYRTGDEPTEEQITCI